MRLTLITLILLTSTLSANIIKSPIKRPKEQKETIEKPKKPKKQKVKKEIELDIEYELIENYKEMTV